MRQGDLAGRILDVRRLMEDLELSDAFQLRAFELYECLHLEYRERFGEFYVSDADDYYKGKVQK